MSATARQEQGKGLKSWLPLVQTRRCSAACTAGLPYSCSTALFLFHRQKHCAATDGVTAVQMALTDSSWSLVPLNHIHVDLHVKLPGNLAGLMGIDKDKAASSRAFFVCVFFCGFFSHNGNRAIIRTT